jgi:hypothetical protein
VALPPLNLPALLIPRLAGRRFHHYVWSWADDNLRRG